MEHNNKMNSHKTITQLKNYIIKTLLLTVSTLHLILCVTQETITKLNLIFVITFLYVLYMFIAPHICASVNIIIFRLGYF